MDYRAVIIASCWLAIAIISSVYMWVFREFIADIMFGVFLPIGLLTLVAITVTFGVASSLESDKKREAEPSADLHDILSELATITEEIEQIKKKIKD